MFAFASRLRASSVAASMLMFMGCTPSQPEDVSSNPAFAVVVGQRVRLASAIDGYAIRDNVGDLRLSHVTLLPATIAIAVPEVAFKHRLPIETSLTITGAMRRRTLFGSEIYYVVTTNDKTLPPGVQVRLELARGNEGHGWASLNPRYFERADR